MVLLAVISAAAIFYRILLDHSGEYLTRVYLNTYYGDLMPRLIAEKPFWYFLLPMPDIKGVWATTGFVFIYFLETTIGPHATYLVLTTAATVCFGLGLWLVFRRALPSAVGAGALAFSPFNYSVYLWNGSNNVYVMIAGLGLSFGFFFSYIFYEGRRYQLIAGFFFLVIAALSYECWLDVAAVTVVITPVAIVFARRWGLAGIQGRMLRVAGLVVAVAVVYSAIRVRTLANTAIPGLEFQLIWSQPSLSVAFDDLTYNVVFLFYLAASQILPGFVGTSLAIELAGRLDPALLQRGYQPDLYPLVASHYLHIWLMYAAALFAIVGCATALCLRRALRQGSLISLTVGCIGLALLIGSPTHAILKFVAFNGVPFYAYKSTLGVMIVYLALAYGVDLLARVSSVRGGRVVLVSGLALWLGVVAFTRPAWVNENVLEIWGEPGFFGRGFYPDPWRNLKHLVGMQP